MPRQPATPWPTTPGSVFFSDVASGATLSRATKDGRIRRLARGLYSADLRADPAELIARNRWKIVAHLMPDAVIADRSAAEGGIPAGGVLTVISNERREGVTLPGLIVAPVRGVNTGLQSAPGSLMLKELPSAGTARWIGPRTYPVTNSYQALHIVPGASPVAGTLSTTAPHAAGADQIVWGAGPQLTFTTSPVATDTTLLAPEAAQLWVQSTTANVELYLELQDVAPNGTVTPITHGSILGSRSQTEGYDAARTWTAPNGLPVQPYVSLDADRFLTPSVPAKLDVPLQPVTWRLLAGHSLRMLVAPNPGTNCVPTTNFASSPVPYGCMISAPVGQSLAGGVFQLLHGGLHDSFLSVALVPSDSNLIPTIASGATPSSGGVPLPRQW
jgi:uncharacterized protein